MPGDVVQHSGPAARVEVNLRVDDAFLVTRQRPMNRRRISSRAITRWAGTDLFSRPVSTRDATYSCVRCASP